MSRRVKDYLTEKSGGFNSGEVVDTDEINVDVLDALGRPATSGYIISDDGTIIVQFNEDELITVKNGEVLLLPKQLLLEVEHIRISTTSTASLSYRLFLS